MVSRYYGLVTFLAVLNLKHSAFPVIPILKTPLLQINASFEVHTSQCNVRNILQTATLVTNYKCSISAGETILLTGSFILRDMWTPLSDLNAYREVQTL